MPESHLTDPTALRDAAGLAQQFVERWEYLRDSEGASPWDCEEDAIDTAGEMGRPYHVACCLLIQLQKHPVVQEVAKSTPMVDGAIRPQAVPEWVGVFAAAVRRVCRQAGYPSTDPQLTTITSRTIDHLKRAAHKLAVYADTLARTPAADEQRIIWYHGERSYSTGGCEPVCVSPEIHIVFQEFLGKDIALQSKHFKGMNISKLITKIKEKFGSEYATSPKKRGDGYVIHVRTHEVATR